MVHALLRVIVSTVEKVSVQVPGTSTCTAGSVCEEVQVPGVFCTILVFVPSTIKGECTEVQYLVPNVYESIMLYRYCSMCKIINPHVQACNT
jgi:hypothetical protein